VESLYLDFKRKFPDVPEISVARLRVLLDKGEVVLVDARSEKEQAVSRIPGAISVRDFERDVAAHEDETVVTYCTIGGRSGKFARTLLERGFEVYNLEGSILGWTHERGALVGEDGPTRRLHVFRSKYDLAPRDYEAVW
jgi:rhodanese-related sulfurtransferase